MRGLSSCLCGQSLTQSISAGGFVNIAIIAPSQRPLFNFKANENRALHLHQDWQTRRKACQLRDRFSMGIAGRAGQPFKVDILIRNRMAAIGLIALILENAAC